jgi:hypothetical protein
MNGDKVRNCCPITLAQNQEAVGSDRRLNIEAIDNHPSRRSHST